MKIGSKLSFGFFSLVALALVMGAIAFIGMINISNMAEEMDTAYLPEVEVANEMERTFLAIIYNVRGYADTQEESYLDLVKADYELFQEQISQARELSSEHPELHELAEKLPAIQEAADTYFDLVAGLNASQSNPSTEYLTGLLFQSRAAMTDASNVFIKDMGIYLQSMENAQASEINSGASGGVLLQRAQKIRLANDIIDAVNEIRVVNYRAQATRQYELMALDDEFDSIYDDFEQIRGLTLLSSDLQMLEEALEATRSYQQSIDDVRHEFEDMARIGEQRLPVYTSLIDYTEELALSGIKNAKLSSENTMDLILTMEIVIGVVFFLVLIIGAVLAWSLTRSITRPLARVTELSGHVSRGNFKIQRQDNLPKDELGELMVAFFDMVEVLKYKADILENVAAGDLRDEVKLASEEDGLGLSLKTMLHSLNEILSQVDQAVVQMATGAEQVSMASQDLSQGATEQASSLEEIAASTNEIGGQSKQNSENALQAVQIAKQNSSDAEGGNKLMGELLEVMDRITESSEKTKKIVRTIDDIAFQVNLLALNANVEAARAGKYGRGFAVVAEEVRTLAVRSAQAVQETTEMVEESQRRVESGNEKAKITGQQLGSMMEASRKISDFLDEISHASKEQAQGIDQINKGLSQIDEVTQANTASAEESASASEELSSQAQHLKTMLRRFQLRGVGGRSALPGERKSLGTGYSALPGSGPGPAQKRSSGSTGSGPGPKKESSGPQPRTIELEGDFEDF